MHVHILGICGTFMGGIAAIAREAGHRVTGADANAWPPMSTQLEQLGIAVTRGFDPSQLDPAPDLVIVGNVVTRGNPAMEYVLDHGLPYTSGPQWLAENVLLQRHVLAVAGTHGKTTTASLLAWILQDAGLEPGFLIGGAPLNFGVSARLGTGEAFVIEADEYDTAFFDKRSKFIHYRPRTVILNNLEFDHADIFDDLAAIERQFHHLIRTVPASGRLIVNGLDQNLPRVLAQGCWTPVTRFNAEDGWSAQATEQGFQLQPDGQPPIDVRTDLMGAHNRSNALAAMAAAAELGVSAQQSAAALSQFQNVRRRLEPRGEEGGVRVFDDFAHHPTAVRASIKALRERAKGRVLAVLEPRSNTMRLGSMSHELADSLKGADLAFVYARPDLAWDANAALAGLGEKLQLRPSVAATIDAIIAHVQAGDAVLIMSNGDFGNIHQRLLERLRATSL